jgi:cysteine desulfurase
MTPHFPIYMDYGATTPVDQRVVDVMIPWLREHFGNPASRSHAWGWEAEAAVEKAREQVAALINADPREIIWTSGATESDNLAIKGAAEFNRERGNHIVTASIEHKAVLDTCKRLEKDGFEVTYLPVEKDGRVSPAAVKAAMTDKTIVVSIMLANNEIGTVNPIEEIGAVVKERGAIFHTDAVQGVGKIPFDVNKARADLVSISAHKMYGPKGIGALYVRRKPRVRITAQIDGGGHERGMRSGTLNVPAIVGFGKAAELCRTEMASEAERLIKLRQRLLTGIQSQASDTFVNGSLEHRLPGNLNISFAYVEGEAMLMGLKDVAVSSGSACTSASLEPSYVLRALGVAEEMAHTSIRFGLGRFTTEEEVDYVIKLVVDKVKKLRELSPLYEMAQAGIDLKSITWAAH